MFFASRFPRLTSILNCGILISVFVPVYSFLNRYSTPMYWPNFARSVNDNVAVTNCLIVLFRYCTINNKGILHN